MMNFIFILILTCNSAHDEDTQLFSSDGDIESTLQPIREPFRPRQALTRILLKERICWVAFAAFSFCAGRYTHHDRSSSAKVLLENMAAEISKKQTEGNDARCWESIKHHGDYIRGICMQAESAIYSSPRHFSDEYVGEEEIIYRSCCKWIGYFFAEVEF